MNNVIAIFRREFAGFFSHALAYIVLTVFVLLVSSFTLLFDDIFLGATLTMNRVFFWIAASLCFLIPATTMRLIAEERHSGSLELLVTLPISSFEIIFGKWLASVALVWIALILTITWPAYLALLGDLDIGPVLGGYAGLAFLGAAYSAIGVLTSSITSNQVVAFVLAFFACLFPWLLGIFLGVVPGTFIPIVQYLTTEYHFANLARGVFDSRSAVFFCGIIAIAIATSTAVLEHRRLS